MRGARISGLAGALLSVAAAVCAVMDLALIAAALAVVGGGATVLTAFGPWMRKETRHDTGADFVPPPLSAPSTSWQPSAESARPGRPAFDATPLLDARRRLAFARAISAKVPPITEDAAFALIESFEDMRGNTSKAANSAKVFKAAIVDGAGAGHPPVAVQAEHTRGVIRSQRSSIAQMAERNRKGAKDLRSMGKEIESGMDLLKGIEEITERSRLIAFNMAVEAARIGEKGRGFRVIVGELRKLNDMTADFSRQVTELLARFRETNAAILSNLAEETDRVARDVQGGMDAAEEAVESLISASATADSFAREIAALAVVIDNDLSGVLESLQFQDITRQMIEGAMEVIDEAKSDVEACLAAVEFPAGGSDLARLEEIRKTLLARSKTKGEKEAIMEVKA